MKSASHLPAGRLLHQLAIAFPATDLPDRELLERFVLHQDEAAFAALVGRHGPLVLGVGRRVLRDAHAAEDVFQASFLVLARRASMLRQPERLGPWLYGVAVRIARKARAAAVRRREHERRAAWARCFDLGPDHSQSDWRSALDEVLMTLPEKYRMPIVLCYFESRTVTEASAKLGWPRGTVATRLDRGRKHLRRALMRRGVTMSSAALMEVVIGSQGTAAVPIGLSWSTVHAALRYAAGHTATAVVPARIAALAEGGWCVMSWSKGKLFVLALLVVGALGIGIGSGKYQAGPGEPIMFDQVPPAASSPDVAKDPGQPGAKPVPLAQGPRVFQINSHLYRAGAKPGAKELLSKPTLRTLDNQMAIIQVGADLLSTDHDEKPQTLSVGFKAEIVAKFGKEPGTVVLTLTLANVGAPRTSGARSEQQTLTTRIRDTVKLGKPLKYSAGRDADDRPMWIELVVWEVKEVLVGQDNEGVVKP